MAAFELADPDRPNRLDWRILLNGAISLFSSQIALDEACKWFDEHQYLTYRFDCTRWTTEETFYAEMRETLNLPDYCGGNLDSLSDCLADIAIPYDGGAIVVFDHFEAFVKGHLQLAQGLLDIFEISSRRFLLIGQRLIALVQVDDPKIVFEPVGACPVLLNPIEYAGRFRKQMAQAGERFSRGKATKKGEI
jgi:RNAse (barnase) inhibitor barstar